MEKKSGNCLLESCQLHQKFTDPLSKIHFIYRVFMCVYLLVFIFGNNPAFPPTSRLLDPLINLDLTNNRDLKDTQFRKYENSHVVGMDGFKLLLLSDIRKDRTSFEVPFNPNHAGTLKISRLRGNHWPHRRKDWEFDIFYFNKLYILPAVYFTKLYILPAFQAFLGSATPFCGLVGDGEVLGLGETLVPALLKVGIYLQ